MESDDRENDDARTIFCANLHENVTEELLYELFLQVGPLERVKIPSNNNYGFVTYQHECSVDYALEVFKDTFLYGSALRLKRRQQRYRENDQGRSGPRMNPWAAGSVTLGNVNDQRMMPLMGNSRNGDSRHSNRSRSPPRRDNRPPPSRNRYDNRQNKRYDYDDKYSDQRHNHNDRRNHKRYKR